MALLMQSNVLRSAPKAPFQTKPACRAVRPQTLFCRASSSNPQPLGPLKVVNAGISILRSAAPRMRRINYYCKNWNSAGERCEDAFLRHLIQAVGAALLVSGSLLAAQPGFAVLNKFEEAAGGEFGSGTALQYGSAEAIGRHFDNEVANF